MRGRVLARGVTWREGERLFSVYARPGDRLPTLRVRCMNDAILHKECMKKDAIMHEKCMKNDDYVCRKCMKNDAIMHEKCITSPEAGTGKHASRQIGGVIFEG